MHSLSTYCSASTIKRLAISLMFLDHIHQMFGNQGAPDWLTMVGRMVFPLFLFLAADSFYYTRDRKKFLLRLYLASSCMVLGSKLVTSLFPNDQLIISNNAFSTFFVTGLYIQAYDWIKTGLKEKQVKEVWKGIGLASVPLLTTLPILFLLTMVASPDSSPVTIQVLAFISLLLPSVLSVEGGFLFVILGLFFYIAREKRWLQVTGLVLLSVYSYLSSPDSFQWMLIFAALPMVLYNGQKGHSSKYFFYIFYPVHIYLLYILATVW